MADRNDETEGAQTVKQITVATLAGLLVAFVTKGASRRLLLEADAGQLTVIR